MQAQPDYGQPLCVLAMIDAALGNKDLALEEGHRSIAVTPLQKDVIASSRVLQYFAVTAAWAGEKGLALHQLEEGLHAPVRSYALSYGGLRLLPFWDPLRGDPHFEQIVASLAPADARWLVRSVTSTARARVHLLDPRHQKVLSSASTI